MHLQHQEKSLIGLWAVLYVFVVVWCGTGQVWAQEPGQQEKAAVVDEAINGEWKIIAKSEGVKIVAQSIQKPGLVLINEKESKGSVTVEHGPLQIAEEWLLDKGFEQGRNFRNGTLYYFSIGAASVNAPPDDSRFIESRYLAFQRAELVAKAKTASFIGLDITTDRGSSDRTISPQERAELESLVNSSPTLKKNILQTGIAEDVYGLFQKAKRLAEAKLDQALADSGVDVETEKRAIENARIKRGKKQKRAEKKQHISEASMTAAACALANIQGTQIIQAFEGSMDGSYQVVVVSVWTQNLQRMVDSMSSGRAPHNLPIKIAKQEVTSQLPKNAQHLACLSGVRAYINQHGEHVLLSFGQAGVEVIGGRKDKAYELAGKKARLRAMINIRNFMGEKVAFKNVEQLREVLAMFGTKEEGNEEREYKAVSQFSELIQAEAKKQKITGIHGLQTFRFNHPFTDRPMVLKVMAWSPASQKTAAEVKEMIQRGADREEAEKPTAMDNKPRNPARKGVISSGEGGDLDAI